MDTAYHYVQYERSEIVPPIWDGRSLASESAACTIEARLTILEYHLFICILTIWLSPRKAAQNVYRDESRLYLIHYSIVRDVNGDAYIWPC
eukprot:6214322-Pleurochrysis_carterae.AAC.3